MRNNINFFCYSTYIAVAILEFSLIVLTRLMLLKLYDNNKCRSLSLSFIFCIDSRVPFCIALHRESCSSFSKIKGKLIAFAFKSLSDGTISTFGRAIKKRSKKLIHKLRRLSQKTLQIANFRNI